MCDNELPCREFDDLQLVLAWTVVKSTYEDSKQGYLWIYTVFKGKTVYCLVHTVGTCIGDDK